MQLCALFLILIAPVGAPQATAAPRAAASAPLSPDALYSRRALRRARLLIQMRMMEFREERLECVRAALMRQLPPALRPQEPTTWSRTIVESDACLLPP